MALIYAAQDTETGGLIPANADLLTCYIGMFDEDFKLLEELDLKLKPDNGRLPIAEAGALKVNGIDLKKHMEDPTTITYAEGRIKVMDMYKRHLKKNGRYSNLLPMAYNYDFDCKWIQYHLLSEADWQSLLHYGKIDPKMCVDFLKSCGWLPKELGSLVSAAEYFKVTKRNAHTAKDDTFMMVDVYKAILALMKAKKDGGASQDIISILEAE
jgi:DNA polymerase III epsilon subunit-like protein